MALSRLANSQEAILPNLLARPVRRTRALPEGAAAIQRARQARRSLVQGRNRMHPPSRTMQRPSPPPPFASSPSRSTLFLGETTRGGGTAPVPLLQLRLSLVLSSLSLSLSLFTSFSFSRSLVFVEVDAGTKERSDRDKEKREKMRK